jgi:hypothetical protein
MSATTPISEQTNGLPTLCGHEQQVAVARKREGPFYLPESRIDFGRVRSAFAIALHMHQPLIPAGGDDLRSARIISNLQYMMEHPGEGDNHNAPVFRECYKRTAGFVADLVNEGKDPRVMLEYSGCLLHGLRMMGADDVIDALRSVTCDGRYRRCIEWLGMPWGHPVAPSTPAQDFRLHVVAWQHHFAGMFGLDALSRVRGFSPSEMALPNEPNVAHEFVRTLKDCGYDWVLVQEHTIETLEGEGIRHPHRPHRLVVRNSSGETLSITAIIKTQGSDTKLVAQMQPYYEARGLGRASIGGHSVPALVTQISDGENGGVMMNEFPGKYLGVMREASGAETCPVNVTEHLEYLRQVGVKDEDFPPIQPIHQHRIWERFDKAPAGTAMHEVIKQLEKEDDRFHVEGGSWTSDRSWVEGYDGVLGAMEEASAMFADRVLAAGVSTAEQRYLNALYHLLASQTSCYRYWGEGRWTDYGKEICRRAMDILEHDF